MAWLQADSTVYARTAMDQAGLHQILEWLVLFKYSPDLHETASPHIRRAEHM